MYLYNLFVYLFLVQFFIPKNEIDYTFRDHKHALQALQNMNENSERFGLSGKQVNVQFAIENSLILKKREERIRVSGDFLKELFSPLSVVFHSLILRMSLPSFLTTGAENETQKAE
jgi:hypothetical protein